jgi:hypothetical protein
MVSRVRKCFISNISVFCNIRFIYYIQLLFNLSLSVAVHRTVVNEFKGINKFKIRPILSSIWPSRSIVFERLA